MSDELLARCRSFIDEQSCGEWDDKAIDEDAAKLYEFVQREAASALRLAAQSPEPVAWQWLFGGVWHTICKHDVPDLERYARSQSEVVRPIYTAPPQSASDGVLRKALAWCVSEIELEFSRNRNAYPPDPEKKRRFDEAKALAASEATKSDGGVEGHAKCDSPIRSAPAKHPQVAESLNEQGHDADIAGIKPGPSDLDSRLERLQVEASDLGYVLTREPEHPDSPHASDTRPADVTVDELTAALDRLVNAKALKGVRSLVAGWNGEDRDEPYKERHPSRLGATLPKTNCGAVYELDEAMQSARALLDTYKIGAK